MLQIAYPSRLKLYFIVSTHVFPCQSCRRQWHFRWYCPGADSTRGLAILSRKLPPSRNPVVSKTWDPGSKTKYKVEFLTFIQVNIFRSLSKTLHAHFFFSTLHSINFASINTFFRKTLMHYPVISLIKQSPALLPIDLSLTQKITGGAK